VTDFGLHLAWKAARYAQPYLSNHAWALRHLSINGNVEPYQDDSPTEPILVDLSGGLFLVGQKAFRIILDALRSNFHYLNVTDQLPDKLGKQGRRTEGQLQQMSRLSNSRSSLTIRGSSQLDR
jgi:hypothetical protein